MARPTPPLRTKTVCAEGSPRGRGAAFVWVSAVAFLTYLGVAVAAGRQDVLGSGAMVLPEDSATVTSGARPSKSHWIDTRWGSPLNGRASWYGSEFQGSPTASGEPFDMHGLTAAHRTLPLGSRALVRNLENDRTVVVKINDRGPFKKTRVLDLSYGAAKQIGMARAGSARVEITPL
jgi:rare lipoprotein A (RlpA)-like double-psi beta-barrel protein